MDGRRGDTDSPWRGWQKFHVGCCEGDCRHLISYDMSAIGRTRHGEGGKNSTLDVAKAIAEYASS